MSRSKTGTPVSDNHPANNLTYIEEEIKLQLQKTPFQLLLESENYQQQLHDLRNSWKFAFVVQWLYLFRGAIRLSGEPFTVDLLEEELVGITEPNLIHKISTNLVSVLLGAKVAVEDFSFKARYVLGETTSILGTEDEPIKFDSLTLIEKFDLFYQLIFQLQYTDNFRKQVEKYEKENELRIEPIFELGDESYFLLSDNRIYLRKMSNFPELKIPRKYKHAKKILNPEVDFPEIEPTFEWECIANGIYQIHDFLVSIAKDKKKKELFQNIKENINTIAADDLTRRKKIVKRKREQQLNELVSNRKRSSRLQEREEQLRIEKEQREAEEARQREEQRLIKLAKKVKAKENQIRREFEERLRSSSSTRRTTVFDSGYTPGAPPKELELEEGGWLFECYCGVRELNYDDGGKLISCERCQRWQHLKCQDRSVQQELIRNSNEIFICNWCKQELEIEVESQLEAKLEAERLQREKELEERQRNRELQKKRQEEERLRAEEEERKRKEELEQERQRRILERERLKESGVYGSPVPFQSPTPTSTPASTNHEQHQQDQSSQQSSFQASAQRYQQNGLPAMGSFQVFNSQTPVFNNGLHSNGITASQPQSQAAPSAPPQSEHQDISQTGLHSQPQVQSSEVQAIQAPQTQSTQPQIASEVTKVQQEVQQPLPQPTQQAEAIQPSQFQTTQVSQQTGNTPSLQATQPISPTKPQQEQPNDSPSKQSESPSKAFSIQNILG